ncbi:DGQHR domain-containing protein [Agrobacterium tumefaciens]|uniref:DGQHR domain-containing protein n=1 Tax=Agrobacterium tumefaciens TaxID=358 RepID=UPI0021CE4797|nr:DGQHR domain-containing protein [Agrobacterium tumefaciens]UXS00851.1 DGQHR domain-containing protein [Agrobacterium tumefaciens]
MDAEVISLDYFEATQNVGTFYNCIVKAQDLLRICEFDFRQIKENNGVKEFLGIQRPLKEDRVREIRTYIGTEDASFPTSIVISVDERCVSFVEKDQKRKLVIHPYEDENETRISIPLKGVAKIIDGQHRLKAFEGTNHNWDLTVNIFVGADEGTQAMIFSKVNLAQTKVNKSIVYDLFSLDRDRSPEKTSHEIVVNLNAIQRSPFFNKIKRLGSATDGVFGETLSQATVVKGVLPYITNDPLTDRDIGRRIGVWPDRGPDDFRKRIFYPFFKNREDHKILAILINYFDALKERWPEAWENNGKGSILARTNGFNGSMRFLRDAYLNITTEPTVPSKDQFAAIFNRSALRDADFTTEKFPPGSSGSSAIYAEFSKLLR